MFQVYDGQAFRVIRALVVASVQFMNLWRIFYVAQRALCQSLGDVSKVSLAVSSLELLLFRRIA